MMNFTFSSVPNTLACPGSVKQLGPIAQQLGIHRVFLVSDPGILAAGLLQPAIHSIKQSDIELSLFTDVEADPSEQTVLMALEQLKADRCDGVIGYGGGSSMDVAKLLSALATTEQPLAEMYGVNQIHGSRLPLIQVPTTSGTGSEATMVSVVTTGQTSKAGVVSRCLLADQIILDPELTVRLPPQVTAATGIDAMVHAIEAFTSRHLKNPVSDMLALQSLRLLSAGIKTAVHNGTDLRARSDMLLGAMMAGQAFANAPVAGVHALAYPLGGIFHIPHGLSNALVLPHVLRFNQQAAKQLYLQLATVILPDANSQSDQLLDRFISYFIELPQQLGLPKRLRELDIPESAIPELAEAAMLQTRLLINNPKEMTLKDAIEIYTAAW